MNHQKDDIIYTLENRQYRILSQAAEGGFSIVYRAEELVGNGKQFVMLKDFSAGRNALSDEQRDQYVQRELLLNRKITESGFQGALTIDYLVQNSDGMHLYGVMPGAPKGKTLREYVYSEGYRFTTLRDRVCLAKRILILVRNFHETCGMIHGDISPDNLYLRSMDNEKENEPFSVVNLLDFGSAQMIGEDNSRVLKTFTPGFSKEDSLEPQREMTMLDDWFSTLSCFWFCLSGQSMDEYPPTYENIFRLHEALAVNKVEVLLGEGDADQAQFVEIRQKNFSTAEYLLREIFLDFNHTEDEIIEKTDKLIDVLNETGISREVLYASLESEYRELRTDRFAELNIISRILPNVKFDLPKTFARVHRTKSSRSEQLQEVMLKNQDSLLMIGDGGMGKTTTLIHIMDESYGEDIPERNMHPVIYLELCTLSQHPEDWYDKDNGGTFLEQFAASYFTTSPRKYVGKDHPYVSALQEEFYRNPEDGKKQYTFLLDGLNEIGFINEKSRKIFYDVMNHYLEYAHNIRIVLTGRSDVYELSKEYLQRLYTEGLDDLSIKEILGNAVAENRLSDKDFYRIVNNRNELSSNEYRLWQCLKIPFFLIMYCVMSEKHGVTRQGEILRNFFHDKRETLDGRQKYGEKVQITQKQQDKQYDETGKLSLDLSIRVVLDFIMPEIALFMAFHNLYFISYNKMLQIIRSYFENNGPSINEQKWRKWYYGYELDIADILRRMAETDNGERIPYYACYVLGLMRQNANGSYFFTHQHFRDYFAACAYINRILNTLEAARPDGGKYYAWEEEFHEYMEPFEEKTLPVFLAAPIGEILGECHNMPYWDEEEKNWKYPDKQRSEQSALEDLLNRYRNHPDMQSDKKAMTGLKNLIAIFKYSRIQNDGKADFSGLSFQGLDVRDVALSGIIMSRFGSTKTITADFKNTRGLIHALKKDDTAQRVECVAVHPGKNSMLLYDRENAVLSEADMDNSESQVIATDIFDLLYVFYMRDGGILLICSSEEENGIEPEKDKKPIFSKVLSLGSDNEDCGNFSIRYLSKKQKDQIIKIEDVREIVGAEWSEEYQELSLALMHHSDPAHLKIYTYAAVRQKTSDNGHIVQIRKKGNYLYPENMDIAFFPNRNMFMMHRISPDEYLISDVKYADGMIGLWNVKNQKLFTYLYIAKESMEHKLYACCKGAGTNKIHFIGNDKNLISQEPTGICAVDENLSFHMFIQPDKKIQSVSYSNDVLVLDEKTFYLVDMDEREIKWCSDLEVLSYFYAEEYIIANCSEGIYRIELADGNATCYQRFEAKKASFAMGQTNMPDAVLLYENSGILKWIDVHSGCCIKHTVIQLTEEQREENLSFFADNAAHKIYGLKEEMIYVWDEFTGTALDRFEIPRPVDAEYLWSEFIPDFSGLYVYYVHINYRSFPAKKWYSCDCFHLEEKQLRGVEIPGGSEDIIKAPFRIYRTRKGQDHILEYLTPEDRARKKIEYVAVHRIGEKYGMLDRFLDVLKLNEITEELEEDEEDMDDFLDDDILSLEHSAKISWKDSYPHLTNDRRHLLCYIRNIMWLPAFILREKEMLLGLTTDGILLASENRLHGTDLRYINSCGEELIKWNLLHKNQVYSYSIVQDVLIVHAADKYNYSEKLMFWNIQEDDVYDYQITGNLALAKCQVTDSEVKQAGKGAELLYMQGAGERKKHFIGQVKRTLVEEKASAMRPLEQIRYWNVPVILSAALLTAISIGLVYFITPDFSEWNLLLDRNILLDRYIKVISTAAVYFLLYKLSLPLLMQKIPWGRFYGYIGTVLVSIVLVLICFGMERWLWNYYFSLTTGTILLMPFYAAYAYYRPKKSIWNTICCLFGLALYISFLVVCGIGVYSGTLLVTLTVMLLFAFLFTELTWRGYNITSQIKAVLQIAVIIVIFLACAYGILGKYFLHKVLQGFSDEIIYSSTDWSVIRGGVEEVLRNSSLIGAAQHVTWNANNLDYIERYPVNYMIRECGLLPAFLVLFLLFFMVCFMYIGARKQTSPMSKIICKTCTAVMMFQLVISLLPNFGIQIIPPYSLPFFGFNAAMQSHNFLILAVYMAFYGKTNKRKKRGAAFEKQ